VPNVGHARHENTFLYYQYVRKRNHKRVKLKNDKGWRIRKARAYTRSLSCDFLALNGL